MKKNNYTENIIQIIQDSKFAVSHSEIQKLMGNSCNRVTIYRILDKLEEKGLVHKIMNLDGVTKFAACNTCDQEKHMHNHIHFSCNKCSQVTCLDSIEPKIELPLNYLISQVNYTVSGLCPECH